MYYYDSKNFTQPTPVKRTSPFILLGAIALLFIILSSYLLIKGSRSSKVEVSVQKDMYLETLINEEPRSSVLLNSLEFDQTPSLIAGESGIIIDADTGKIIYGKNINQKMPIASLVKIMTALVTIEHKNLSDYATVDSKADSVGENEMGISEGEAYTTEELLYGLLLNSGNDAAYCLAENVAGSEEEFVRWMNRKAGELGLKDTMFYDPSGLDDRSYSTVSDLAVLTSYALKYQPFRDIVRTVEKELPYSDKHKYLYLYNQTNLLTTYPGVMGVKTGYTEEAGLCLSTYAENSGKKLIGVVLDSIDRKGDMILMLDRGFSEFGIIVEHHLLD